MRRISVLFLAVLFGGTALCAAQQQNKWEVFGGYSFARVFGYPNFYAVTVSSANQGTYDSFSAFNMNGGQASVTYFPVKHFGLTGDFTIFEKTQNVIDPVATGLTATQAVHEQDYLFGPTFRYTLKAGNHAITLFAHQLFGVAHSSTAFTPSSLDCSVSSSGSSSSTCSANPFTMVSGGGVDVRVASHIAIRPAQLDYFEQQLSAQSLFGSGSTTDSSKLGVDGFRYSAGAVVNF